MKDLNWILSDLYHWWEIKPGEPAPQPAKGEVDS